MIFQWLVGLVAIVALVLVAFADSLAGKKKHSRYFAEVQKPVDKQLRDPNIPDSSKYDVFYSKLNLG